jgi:hypothetical protein
MCSLTSLSNFSLGYVIREFVGNQGGLKLNGKPEVLLCANSVNSVGENK